MTDITGRSRVAFLVNELSSHLQGLERFLQTEPSPKMVEALEWIYSVYSGEQVGESKAELRKRYKGLRRELELEDLRGRGEALNRMVMESELFSEARHIFCYIDFNKEITTAPLIESALKSKRLSVPVVRGEVMVASRLESLGGLALNGYGIPEPVEVVESSPEEIDLVIVPGLVFSPLGYRIGYGGGYYDRFLAGYKGRTAAMVLAEFITPFLVPDSYDLPVERVFSL